MKTLFIPAKYTGKISLTKEMIEKLPLRIGLVSTVQFLDNLAAIKKESIKNISSLNKSIFGLGYVKGIQKNNLISGLGYAQRIQENNLNQKNKKNNKKLKKIKIIIAGQILGCDVSAAEKIKNKVDAFLYVGTGEFHPIALGLLGKDVFVLNPFSGRISKLDKKQVEAYKKRKKTALMRFYKADNVGVLVSLKPGQKFGEVDKIIKRYKDKRFYRFVFDTLDIKELDNFPFIDAWVSTACPRLDEDAVVLNVEELE